MTVAVEKPTATVDLGGCERQHCRDMAAPLKLQLDPDYSRGAAVLSLSDTFEEYRVAHRTARKRAARCGRFGYRFASIDRRDYVEDIYAVNTSLDERQGRPMGESYRQRPSYGALPFHCPRHHVYAYGLLDGKTLVAYLWLYRAGELALVSTILGHAGYLKDDVMYGLFLGMLELQYPLGGMVFYNRFDSGTEGLRFFKRRLGLREGDVTWALS